MDKSPKVNSTLASLVIAALAAGGVALTVEHWRPPHGSRIGTGQQATGTAVVSSEAQAQERRAAAQAPAPAAGGWSASAPGRVEPRNGEVRIGAQMPGKVAQVLVRMNDTVKAGDLLVRLVDDEPNIKLMGADAEVAVRRRERDTEPAVKLQAERRAAEDTLASSQRAAFKARGDLDRLQERAAAGTDLAKDIEAARTGLAAADEKVEQDRAALRRLQAQPGVPLPTRLEASLATARAELALIENAVERTRIRAPADGSVLIVNTRAGETVTPSPEDVLLVFGDVSQLRIRAEIEERDVGKIRIGQAVVVRSDAFPGQDFQGRVRSMASALGAPRISGKGPRRPTEQEVLQVLVDLDGRPAMIPGMRVDVFFKPDSVGGAAAPADSAAN